MIAQELEFALGSNARVWGGGDDSVDFADTFWERPIAGSIITGMVAAITAIAVAFFTYRSAQKSLSRQLDASRDSLNRQLDASSASRSRQLSASRDAWLRDHLLQEVSGYLAAARGLANQAFLVGATQVDVLEKAERDKVAEGLEAAAVPVYSTALTDDKGLRRERHELGRRWNDFSGLVHGVRLLLAPNFSLAEELRSSTDQLFGYVDELRLDISMEELKRKSDRCKQLRAELEEQVARLLASSDLFAFYASTAAGAVP